MSKISGLFDYLRGAYQQRFTDLLRSATLTDEEKDSPERTRYLINGAFRFYFDERTHEVSVSGSEILVKPKASRISHDTEKPLRDFPELSEENVINSEKITAFFETKEGKEFLRNTIKNLQQNKEL